MLCGDELLISKQLKLPMTLKSVSSLVEVLKKGRKDVSALADWQRAVETCA
jgi:hypothetical protein